MPLIIAVPHGGAMIPQDIPNRDFGSIKKDRHTIQVAKAIVESFESRGLKPYLITMNLHRRKIDVNRGSKEGAQDPRMLAIYKDYHNIIKSWRLKIQKKYGYCLIVDLHGQISSRGFVELGYGLTKEHILSLDDLDIDELSKYSSLRVLLKKFKNSQEVFIGKRSFGNILMKYGYSVFPSKDIKHIEDVHFNGVYTLHRHVVKRRNEKNIGFNIELSYDGIRDTEKNRIKFASAFSSAVTEYLKINFRPNQKWLRIKK